MLRAAGLSRQWNGLYVSAAVAAAGGLLAVATPPAAAAARSAPTPTFTDDVRADIAQGNKSQNEPQVAVDQTGRTFVDWQSSAGAPAAAASTVDGFHFTFLGSPDTATGPINGDVDMATTTWPAVGVHSPSTSGSGRGCSPVISPRGNVAPSRSATPPASTRDTPGLGQTLPALYPRSIVLGSRRTRRPPSEVQLARSVTLESSTSTTTLHPPRSLSSAASTAAKHGILCNTRRSIQARLLTPPRSATASQAASL